MMTPANDKLLLLIDDYLNHPCFNADTLYPTHPYHRPLRRQDFKHSDFTQPITSYEIISNKNLLINKLLLTIYEQDLLFLPDNFYEPVIQTAFKSFYDPHFVSKGKQLKPLLEQLTFNLLDQEIEPIGHWTTDKLVRYLSNIIEEQEKQKSDLCEAIAYSQKPMLAAKMLLTQMAPDFLSEASAMARVLPGSFGQEQSEIMKIFIDEYGYGVHTTKHSSLFEKTLLSVGMNHTIHYYYDAYLPTSLMLVNYFHFVCSNKHLWFRYLGALYYTEASIPHFNRQFSKVLNAIFPSIDTHYFDEHVHIDQHHRRMVLNKLIVSSIEKYGEEIIHEVLKGFESFRFLQSMADCDLIAQIRFVETASYKKNFINKTSSEILFNEYKNELTLSHIHDASELFTVKSGQLSFHHNGLEIFSLAAGESLIIPKGRVHGTYVNSPSAEYSVKAIELAENEE